MNLRSWLSPARQPAAALDSETRRRWWIEIAVVLLVTVGLQALGSAVSLLEALLVPTPLAEQSVALNATASESQLIDFLRQLLRALRLLAWGALALYLLWRSGIGPKAVGFALRRIDRRDALAGIGLATLIGLPGLALYLAGNAFGVTKQVVPSALDDHWWTVPMLVLSALANAVAEETIVVAYLLTRLRQLGVHPNTGLALSALLRGAYHLYQGLGAFVGNVLMGLVFGRYWERTGRLWPLVIAHALIDVTAFVGYALLAEEISWLPG
jgi:membrane protease YdiL (CAAX protease family)